MSDGVTGGMSSAAQDQDSVAHEFGHGINEDEVNGGFISSNDTVDGAAAIEEAFGDWSSTVVEGMGCCRRVIRLHRAASNSTDSGLA